MPRPAAPGSRGLQAIVSGWRLGRETFAAPGVIDVAYAAVTFAARLGGDIFDAALLCIAWPDACHPRLRRRTHPRGEGQLPDAQELRGQRYAIVAPPVPAFYARPETIGEMIDHSLGRVLDLFGIESGKVRRWKETPESGRSQAGGRNRS